MSNNIPAFIILPSSNPVIAVQKPLGTMQQQVISPDQAVLSTLANDNSGLAGRLRLSDKSISMVNDESNKLVDAIERNPASFELFFNKDPKNVEKFREELKEIPNNFLNTPYYKALMLNLNNKINAVVNEFIKNSNINEAFMNFYRASRYKIQVKNCQNKELAELMAKNWNIQYNPSSQEK